MKKYSAIVLSLCMVFVHADNRVSSFTKLKNGIITSSWRALFSTAVATGVMVQGLKSIVYVDNILSGKLYDNGGFWDRSNKALVSASVHAKVIQALMAGTLVGVISVGGITYRVLRRRTEPEIKRVAGELKKEIVELTKGGTLTADELTQQLKHKYNMYSNDQHKQLQWLTTYLQKLITHAEWYNEKLAVLHLDPIPHVALLKAVLQKVTEK